MSSSSSLKVPARRRGAWLVVGLLVFATGCSKDKEVKRVWDGAPVFAYPKGTPKAKTAAKIDFGKVPLAEGPANLKVPVNWKQNPHKNKRWQTRLHRWEWMWPLLTAFEKSKDKESLKEATKLALDWVDKNPLQGGEKSAA